MTVGILFGVPFVENRPEIRIRQSGCRPIFPKITLGQVEFDADRTLIIWN